MRGAQPLAMARADTRDPSLDDVPGRGRHGFHLLVQPEFLDGDDLHLEIWEGRVRVFRANLYVDRSAEPLLRRHRDTSPLDGTSTPAAAAAGPRASWWRRRQLG